MRKRGLWAVLLALALVLGAVPLAPAKEAEAAKKKMKLSKTKLTLTVGKTKKLTVKNKAKKAKVTWTTSKKKVATVSKKGVVKAKKAGKTTITAKVKYKKKTTKLKCKVTVKKAKKKQPTEKPESKPTVKPTAQATAGPTDQAVQPPADPTPSSGMPEPAKAKEWDTEKMGLFSVSGIRFADNSLTYQLGKNVIYLDMGSRHFDVKEAVPDLTKCTFEVYAGGKSYASVLVGNVKWNSIRYIDEELDMVTDGGYYEFTLYINVDGTTYSSSWAMVEYMDEVSDSGENFLISAIKSGQKIITPQKDMRSVQNHYMFDPAGASVKADLPDLQEAEFTASYMGKNVEIEKISKIRWFDQSYYDTYEEGTGYYTFTLDARNGAQRISLPVILSDYKDQLDVYQYSWKLDGKENKEPVQEYNTIFSVEVSEGRSLKEAFPDLSAAFTFDCLYRDKVYKDIKPGNVEWVNEPFHDNQCDSGYYTFTLSVTADGKVISREFILTEEYRGITYEVSGKLYSGTGETPSGQELRFWSSVNGDDYKVTTGEGGTYRIQLPEGNYQIYWNGCWLNQSVKVGKKDMAQQDIRTEMYKVSGVMTRMGKPMSDCDIRFCLSGEGGSVLCRTGKDGSYSVWLPKGRGVWLKTNDAELTGFDFFDMLFDISGNISKNIEINRIKVTGTINKKDDIPLDNARCRFEKDGDTFCAFNTDGEGHYEVYLEPDSTYTLVYAEGISAGTVQAGRVDIVKDATIGVTRLKGTLKTKSGGVVSESQKVNFYAADGTLAAAVCGVKSYSVDLKPGVYTIKIETELYDEYFKPVELELDQKVTVGSENQITDLITPLNKVSGIVSNNSERWCDGRVDISNSAGHSMTMWTSEEDGSYEIYLPAGTYFFNIRENDARKQTIVITDSDIQQDLNYSYPIVKGKLYRVKQGQQFEQNLNIESSLNLDIVDEEDNYIETIYPEDGTYQCYVPGEGAYKVKYKNMVVDTFTVGSGLVTKYDIVCKLYLVSGIVKGVRDMKYVYNTMFFTTEGEYHIWTDTGILDVSTREQPFLALLTAGTYQYRAYFNGDVKEGELTVSGDMTGIMIDMPVMTRISGVLTDSEGNPCPRESIQLVSEDGSTGYYTSDQMGGYQFYSHPGTYTVYCMVQKDGMDMSYKHGTLTVGEEDVTYNIQKKAVEEIGSGDIVGPGPVNPPDMQQYKISGTLSGKSGVWTNTEIQIGGNVVTTDESGRYNLTVLPGEYPVYIPGLEDQKPEVISVKDSDVEKDISLDYVRIGGKLLHGGEPAGECGLSLWTGQGESQTYVANIQTKEDGSYTFYMSSDAEYVIRFDAANIEFDPVRVQQEDIMDHDLIMTQTKVSGTVLAADNTPIPGAGIEFVEIDKVQNSSAVCNNDGIYCAYLQPGTYNVLCRNKVIKESVVVGNTDMTCNVATSFYRVEVVRLQSNEVVLFDEEGARETFGCDQDGKCSLYLENGTYTLVNIKDAFDLETKEEISLQDIADNKKTTFTVANASTKIEMK